VKQEDHENDSGKSTLTAAIRAGLLLPVQSSEGQKLVPWHRRDQAPRILLQFVDDEDRRWRVRKTFGDKPSAELEATKDDVYKDGSGKLRLTAALKTLAQDPLFKKVLDGATGSACEGWPPGGVPSLGLPRASNRALTFSSPQAQSSVAE
jgi:hypothetical protein